MAEKTLNTIIVLRNGTKEAWEADGSYILTTGEVGVGYMTVTVGEGDATTTKTVPIVKIGDGATAWKDLPQAEGVFEKDVVLTAPLGKYTPTSAGYIKIPNSAGMTTSELLLDALSEVKEPTITAPTFTLTATQPGIVEVGTSITTFSRSVAEDNNLTLGTLLCETLGGDDLSRHLRQRFHVGREHLSVDLHTTCIDHRHQDSLLPRLHVNNTCLVILGSDLSQSI